MRNVCKLLCIINHSSDLLHSLTYPGKMFCIGTLFYWLGFPFVFLSPRGDKWSNISGVDQKFSITNGNLKNMQNNKILFRFLICFIS